jgi:hypothetical protein
MPPRVLKNGIVSGWENLARLEAVLSENHIRYLFLFPS